VDGCFGLALQDVDMGLSEGITDKTKMNETAGQSGW
jgi:hypothetical protein